MGTRGEVEAVAYSEFRRNLKGYMDKARDDAEPIMVTTKDPSSSVVVLNIRDYESMAETMRVYENPYLLDKILRGIE